METVTPHVPAPQVDIIAAYKAFWTNYLNFQGRTRRSGFWWVVLINVIVGLIPIVNIVYGLAALLPSIAMCVRRLQDTGRAWYWLLLCLVPIVGSIVLIVFYCQDSQPGANQFGPNPKGL